MDKWLQPALASLVLAIALVLRWTDPPTLSDLRTLVFDQYQRVAPREYKPVPVKIVDIDDESLARAGQWPWPRSTVAQLLAKLRESGAAVVAMDILFAEPDRTAPARVLPGWGVLSNDDLALALTQRVQDPDEALAEELAKGRVVLGVVLFNKDSKPRVTKKGGYANLGVNPRENVFAFAGALPAIPILRDAAAGNGAINPLLDRDAVVRRVPMILNGGGDLYPSLVAEALRVAVGASTYIVKSTGSQSYTFGGFTSVLRRETGVGEVGIGPVRIRTDPSAAMWLYDTGHRKERFIPAWKVLAGQAGDLNGTIVFIGTSAPGLLDLRSTPIGTAVPGVEVHAQIVEQILTGDIIERPLWADDLEFFTLLVLGSAMALLLPRMGAIGCAILGGTSMIAAFAFGWWAFWDLGWLIDPVYPSMAALAVFTTGILLSFRRSDVERKRVRDTFSHYLAPAMVKRLVANPGLVRLGGEVRDMTIMFLDIRDFTTISERMEATALTTLLNDFLTPMSEAVMENGGTIDKYIGDSIMAFWNAPLDDPDHAKNACRATLEMRRRLSTLNKVLAERAQAAGQPYTPIMIGIGLNSGDALVGNLGARSRVNYSVIGDNVNLASRIEGVSKNFGLDILIGEHTREAAPEFAAIPIGDIFVKGKTLPARLFALIGGPEVAQAPQAEELLTEIAKAAHSFKGGNLAAANAALAAARALGQGLGLEPLFDHMSNMLVAAEGKAKAAAAQ
ncbi:CHASE2 domain-containing protein [Dongia deserti]|uniref:CHASE2 domain-containing protein n=1 Tax=Dongia deserti TaxID=2268030 RepID=UPI000E650838|nr:adenylate/guanylate cyclase domain-containing protein [Dongia deserti]